MLLKPLFAVLGIWLGAMLGTADVADAGSATSEAALTAKQRSIIPIAAFTADGNVEKLKAALADGLQNGMTVNEIREVLVQMYAYAGFPRSLTGLNTFLALLDERKARASMMRRAAAPRPCPRRRTSANSAR